MYIYRSAGRQTTPSQLLAELKAAAAARMLEAAAATRIAYRVGSAGDSVYDLLLAAGALECALADLAAPDRDCATREREAALATLRCVARMLVAAPPPQQPTPAANLNRNSGATTATASGTSTAAGLIPESGPAANATVATAATAAAGGDTAHAASPSLAALLDQLDRLVAGDHRSVVLSNPEGFRYYALDPLGYVPAADSFLQACRPARCCVIGLRSAGSALGAVAAAALERAGVATELLTLRPRGAPDARDYSLDDRLDARLRSQAEGFFLIVDEGPGLSGSTFGRALKLLLGLGASERRIALLCGYLPDAARLSDPWTRERWHRWMKFAAAPLPPPAPGLRDLSGGRWREVFPPPAPVPVWPQHERMKFMTPDGRTIYKFAGLGRYARDAAERMRELARAGFTHPARAAGRGWIEYEVVRARPFRLDAASLRPWAEFTGRYLAFLSANFRCRDRQSSPQESKAPELSALKLPAPGLRATELPAMLRRNLSLLAADAGYDPERCDPEEFDPRLPEPLPAPAVELDARLLPHEFGIAANGFIKFDAADHADDHFFPGPADIAWDLSAIEAEFGHTAAAAVLAEYRRRSGDFGVENRMSWHRVAYCAFRAAECRFASERVPAADAQLFRARERHYLRHLAAAMQSPRRSLRMQSPSRQSPGRLRRRQSSLRQMA
jgi:hypothetical protein